VIGRYAIVGAGLCGLGAAAALKRAEIPFDVYETDDDVGGNWYHGVYETAHIISSRKTTEYTDWPMPADWPDFPSAKQMLTYLRGYADHWGLRPHIRFRTTVERVAPAGGGTWEVIANGERRVYAGVIIANGHHWDKRMPELPGAFSGTLIHGKDYKNPEILKGKRVLTIGGGNTACDIAVEAARFGSRSAISLRRGYWFMPKTMMGVPTVEWLKPWMPFKVQQAMVRGIVGLVVGDYATKYGLPTPDHGPFERHPTINGELLHGIKHGRIDVRPDVAAWDGENVVFADGRPEPFDVVVAATGYHMSIPFLAPEIVAFERGIPQLVGGALVCGHANLYVFGYGQPRYGAGPLVTAGAELLVTMIRTQPQLSAPIADWLARLGARPPHTVLQDPHEVLRRCRQGQRLVPRLPALQRAWPLVVPPPGSERQCAIS
jgi:cation diffusion facilitator CzcD-associated flavoprotein CzcO